MSETNAPPTTPLESALLQRAALLMASLSDVTEQLATTHTQADILEIVLRPAVQTLGSQVGTVLLVQGEGLNVVTQHGQEEITQSIWQDGPLSNRTPATAVLETHEPLFFEHGGGLTTAYPEFELGTGGKATVSSAVLPMFLDGHPLGVLVLDFKESHKFTDVEVYFLRTLVAHCAVALGRAKFNDTLERRIHERTRQIEEEAHAQEVFAAFTESVGNESDVLALCDKAFEVMNTRFNEYSSAYYEVQDGLWKALAWTTEMTAEQISMIRAGLPLDVPSFAQALQTKQPVFIDGWDSQRDQIENTDVFGPVCIYPLVVMDEVHGLFTVGLRVGVQWQDRDRALMRALGRSLTLALERTEAARHLEAQNSELNARNQTLAAFEEWTHDLTGDLDPYELIGRAQALLHTLISLNAALYYEREGERWVVRRMLGEYGSEGLRRAHEAGLPHATTGNLRIPFETGETYYQHVYDAETDQLSGDMTHVTATAMVPLKTSRGVRGILGLGLFSRTGWAQADRNIIETVRRSLDLALDRTEKAAELLRERTLLTERTAALTAANEELEAFAYSVSHDLRTPVRHILGFNDLLRKTLGDTADVKATRYLTVVDDAARRMNILIDAMLDLSRMARVPLRFGPVDLGALLEAVRVELEPEMQDRTVLWVMSPLPLVAGDYDTLRQVVTNLLSNALKYTLPRDEAKVEVWTEEDPEEWRVLVRDNGVGFDPRYGDKLFGVFQRLHRVDEFEGTGVGLANVRRIVQRHGGRVWAQGTPGEGATFGFSLPKVP
ncbi:ATP-binding protein [Deinococcus hopiensis]|uniref:histidine kinase n=1 Tax=Deinococcus hopiensis KR-140 TaxID=695939 RepID=A0A1W1UYH9_9DEIO|nr:ATP-binding protein [Deinococcus hopiensis]SMB86175.1 Bacteriophytochrome (light-regulated signal transduction histidine kinase) [Deinococcus hopiensis KR-140]